MIRLSRMADYGIVLLSYIAQGEDGPDFRYSAKQLAELSNLPLPTVSKVLKRLARADLLTAQRGKLGGYGLARAAADISVADMITAVDGPIALTDCSPQRDAECDIESCCPNKSNWDKISARIRGALSQLTLESMAPVKPTTSPIVIGTIGVPFSDSKRKSTATRPKVSRS